MKKLLALTKGSIMDGLVFRASAIVTVLGNIIYLIIIYYLWRAIYASSPTDVVNGMTFTDTMIYLVLASALFNFMNCFIIWGMGDDFQTGKIALDLLKPIDYQLYWFFSNSGQYVVSFFTSFLPTFLIVYAITKGGISLGINLILFIVSVVFAILLNFCVDFFVGTICLYTQSVWGVNIMKEVIVSLLSGATIPLAFFPDALQKVVNALPFQAIYNIPLTILIDTSLTTEQYLAFFAKQLFWLVVLIIISRGFWLISKRVVTVNGG